MASAVNRCTTWRGRSKTAMHRELTTFLIIGGLITVLDIVMFNVMLLAVGTGVALSYLPNGSQKQNTGHG